MMKNQQTKSHCRVQILIDKMYKYRKNDEKNKVSSWKIEK